MESLNDFKNRALTEFLLRNNESLTREKVIGELPESSCFDISYWYGNGELIACNDQWEVVFGQDYNGTNYSWITLEERGV